MSRLAGNFTFFRRVWVLFIYLLTWRNACERACISIWSKHSPADGSILFGHAPYLFEGGVYLSLIKIRSTICCATLCAMCCVCLLIAITTTQNLFCLELVIYILIDIDMNMFATIHMFTMRHVIHICLSIHARTHTRTSNRIGVAAAVVIECYNIVSASLLWRNVNCENMGEKITIKFVNVRPFVRPPARLLACARIYTLPKRQTSNGAQHLQYLANLTYKHTKTINQVCRHEQQPNQKRKTKKIMNRK